jgi:hypothetical protein
MVYLSVGMKHPVEVVLRAYIETTIGQDRHDLTRRQGREFHQVAVEQDPLALLLVQTVKYPKVATFTAIAAVPKICKLSPPALQGGEPHASTAATSRDRALAATAASKISRSLRRSAGAVNSPSSSPQ